MHGDLLTIQPGDLKFPFELKKQVSCSLRLVNVTSDYVAFKVKTTSPKKYCVRPNTGVVPPQSSAEVTVMMQAQREMPSDMQCKDKFLVQSVVIPQGSSTKDVAQDLFNKDSGREVHEAKLKVVYIAPPQPPSPVAESPEEGMVSPDRQVDVPSKEMEPRASKMEFGSFQEENNPSLWNKTKSSSLGQTVATRNVTTLQKGWSIFHLLLVAILAFVVGYFYGHSPSPSSVS